MIVNLVLGIVASVVGGLLNLLPSVSFPSWLTGSSISTGLATQIGDLLKPLHEVVPIDTILGILQDVLTLWPVLAAFLIFSWIWRHMPTIAGFGTGDG